MSTGAPNSDQHIEPALPGREMFKEMSTLFAKRVMKWDGGDSHVKMIELAKVSLALYQFSVGADVPLMKGPVIL